jgi:hypothetical protein
VLVVKAVELNCKLPHKDALRAAGEECESCECNHHLELFISNKLAQTVEEADRCFETKTNAQFVEETKSFKKKNNFKLKSQQAPKMPKSLYSKENTIKK